MQASKAMQYRARLLWPLTLLLLFGAGLRLWFIGVHGLDADELFTVNFLRAPTSVILSTFAQTVIEVDAKLYYLIHQPWVTITGIGEITLRLPNVLTDVLLGAVLIHTARHEFGRRTALVVGLLWAANPLLIWVAGMVRMYSLLGLLSAVAWISALRAANGGKARWWIIFTLAALAAGYVHVLGLIVIASAGVVIVTIAAVRRRYSGIIALAVIALAYLPYFVNLSADLATARRLGADLPANPLDFLGRFLTAMVDNQIVLPFAIPAILFVTIGVGWWNAPRPRLWLVSLLSMFAIFTLASGYLALRQSIFETRYVAYGVSLFILIAGAGVSQIPWRWLQTGLLMAMVGLGFYGLNAQSQPMARDDFRSAARFLESHADTGDVIITMGDFALPPLQYAYQGSTHTVAPWHDVVHGGFKRKLEQTVAGYDTAWIVLYQTNVVDPADRFDTYFRGRYPIRTEVFPSGLAVRGYDLRPVTDVLPTEAVPVKAVLNNQIALRGYQVYTSTLPAHDDRLHPPSGWVHITLYWEALRPGTDFVPSLHMEDSAGQVWGINITRPNDVFALHPSATWQPGQIWRSDSDVNLNPVAPPGPYNIILRVSAPNSDQYWVDDSGSSAVIITTISVIP